MICLVGIKQNQPWEGENVQVENMLGETIVFGLSRKKG